MEKTFDIITSGYVSMDRIVKIKTPAKVGFTSLVENKTSADVQYGGCSVNIAHNLCKVGCRALPVMRVGSDWEEIGFKNFLEEANIPLSATTMVEDERTSLCYLVQDNMGQHITLFYPGAMDGEYAQDLSDDLFRQGKMGLISVGSYADNRLFFEGCKRNNIPLVFSMKGDFDAFPKDFLLELLSYCAIIFTNEVERESIEGITGESMLKLLDNGNTKAVITTLGKEGSCCYTKDTSGEVVCDTVPICPTETVADTTGTGDGYVAGFLYGWFKEKTPAQCAQLGTVLSSFIVEKEGCCTGAPSEEELLARCEKFSKEYL